MRFDLKDLLTKYQNGTISPDELALLESWYLQWKPESQPISEQELGYIKAEVWQAVDPAARRVRPLWPRIAAVASVVLFLLVPVYYFAARKAIEPEAVNVVKTEVHDFKPGGNRAVLTLANGEQIVLTEAKNGKLAEQGGVVIDKTADGKLIYAPANAFDKHGKLVYNTMSTPRGGQYNLILADGTKVWLNAASSITFPVAFVGKERRVIVNGEAYFEVAHDAGKPFKVATSSQEVTVLGTHFNVKGYADDENICTTLLEGSINLKNVRSGEAKLLTPGQQARVNKTNNDFTLRTINPENAISWKNGYFLFDDQEIQSIMKIMSRWYDVDIEYQNINTHERFGGTFSRASNLSETLQNLEQLGKIHFKIQAKKVIVTD